jgi:hypothetical protein
MAWAASDRAARPAAQTLRWPGSFGRRRPSLSVVQLPKGGFNGTYQLVDSTVDRLLQSRCLVAHRERLEPGETSLKEAALILCAGFLVAIFVAKVNFHPRDLIAEAFQAVFHYGLEQEFKERRGKKTISSNKINVLLGYAL